MFDKITKNVNNHQNRAFHSCHVHAPPPLKFIYLFLFPKNLRINRSHSSNRHLHLKNNKLKIKHDVTDIITQHAIRD